MASMSFGRISKVKTLPDMLRVVLILTWRHNSGFSVHNRVIRRLMEHVGHPVVTLKRIAHGPLRLGALKSGQTQKLSEKEYWALRRKALGC
jgi:23S rRNA pseudouridine2605 synthase